MARHGVCMFLFGLNEEEVIEIHASTVYTVFAVGFIPGFPYMGTLDKRIYAPRLETPRLKVPEGSVGLPNYKQVSIHLSLRGMENYWKNEQCSFLTLRKSI